MTFIRAIKSVFKALKTVVSLPSKQKFCIKNKLKIWAFHLIRILFLV